MLGLDPQHHFALSSIHVFEYLTPHSVHRGTKEKERWGSIRQVQDVVAQNEAIEKRKMQNKANCYSSVRVIGDLGCKVEQRN